MIFSQILGQDGAKTILSGAIKNARIANAYLFSGPEDAPKKQTAIEFIKTLNCICGGSGSCLNCKKIEKNVHPDLIMVEPDGTSIKIDQIRELKKTAQYGPSEAKFLGVIIDPADCMTTEATNSFLKTIEEPASGVTFILITSKEKSMPQTIVSRCQKIFFTQSRPESMSLELESVFENYKDIGKKSPTQALEIAEKISQLGNTKEIEKVLLSLAHWFKLNSGGSQSLKSIRTVMDAHKKIICRTNIRLTLESMNLILGEINA